MSDGEVFMVFLDAMESMKAGFEGLQDYRRGWLGKMNQDFLSR